MLVEVAGAQRLRVARAQLEDVAHLDRRLDRDRRPVRAGVALLHPPDVAPAGVEVAAGLHAAQVQVVLVAARDEAMQAAQGFVGEHLHRRADRADEAGLGLEDRAHLLGLGGPGRGAQRVLKLDLVEAVVAAHQHQHRPAAVRHHGHRLDHGAGGHAEQARHVLDRGGAGRLDPLGRVERPGQTVDGPRAGARHLYVGRVARRGERDVVLARPAGRHVLVGADAAHHPHVRLDPVPLEPGPVEDAVVGLDMELIRALEAVRINVERVRVLHDELAGAEHPGAGPRLVALLGLEVVEDLRQVAVRADLARDVPGDVLLVAQREHEVGAAPVLELEDLVDVVAAGAPPGLGRLDHRHQHLHRADRVELLADDLLDLAVRPPAGRQPGPEAGADLPGEARPHGQAVRNGLGVGRGLARGREEIAGKPGHEWATISP